MIVASLLLIAGAAGLLGFGLWQSSGLALSASIAASVLAAVLLVVGARRVAAQAAPPRRSPVSVPPAAVAPPAAAVAPPAAAASAPASSGEAATVAIPVQGSPTRESVGRQRVDAAARAGGAPQPPAAPQSPPQSPARYEPGSLDEDDPADEPAPQQVSAADAARVSRMTTEVLVADGRPRYHLPGCVHLLGRDNEPLPVAEAVELGFTPCSLCEPDSALLADARRV